MKGNVVFEKILNIIMTCLGLLVDNVKKRIFFMSICFWFQVYDVVMGEMPPGFIVCHSWCKDAGRNKLVILHF